jgi:predicted transcriptional regulator
MRRNDLDICADILRVAKTGAKKTQIVYQANLNFKIVKKYLERLIDNGLLDPASESRFYTTTNRGANFLEQYHDLVSPIKGL